MGGGCGEACASYVLAHALHVFNLPALHRDPFDRMLVSQAQVEIMPIITSDSLIAQYEVEVIWGK